MPILSKPANAAYLAITYITIGALLDVWTLVWYCYLHNGGYDGPAYYVCIGFALTGLILMMIGFGLGHIGRAARNAELPPREVTAASESAEQTAAAHPPAVVPATPAVVSPQAGVSAASSSASPVTSNAVVTSAPPVAKIVG